SRCLVTGWEYQAESKIRYGTCQELNCVLGLERKRDRSARAIPCEERESGEEVRVSGTVIGGFGSSGSEGAARARASEMRKGRGKYNKDDECISFPSGGG